MTVLEHVVMWLVVHPAFLLVAIVFVAVLRHVCVYRGFQGGSRPWEDE